MPAPCAAAGVAPRNKWPETPTMISGQRDRNLLLVWVIFLLEVRLNIAGELMAKTPLYRSLSHIKSRNFRFGTDSEV
jgi:hypothetical protein